MYWLFMDEAVQAVKDAATHHHVSPYDVINWLARGKGITVPSGAMLRVVNATHNRRSLVLISLDADEADVWPYVIGHLRRYHVYLNGTLYYQHDYWIKALRSANYLLDVMGHGLVEISILGATVVKWQSIGIDKWKITIKHFRA